MPGGCLRWNLGVRARCTQPQVPLFPKQSLLNGPVPLGVCHSPRSTHNVLHCWFWTVHPLPFDVYIRGRRILISVLLDSKWVQVNAVWSSQDSRHCLPSCQGKPCPTACLRTATLASLGERPRATALPLPQHLFYWVGPGPFDVLQPLGQRCWTCQYWEKPLFKPIVSVRWMFGPSLWLAVRI